MKRFKEFIKESDPRCADQFPSGLDAGFIRSAVKPTSFNLDAAEFKTTNHKKEIQYITHMLFFPNVNVENIFVDNFNLESVQESIDTLRSKHPDGFNRFALKSAPPGVGPGEMLFYFIINSATMGGGSSAGVDMVDDSGEYEIKGVKYHQNNNYIHDFKVGGTKSQFRIVANKFLELKEKAQKALPEVKWGTEENGVSGLDMARIRELAKTDPENFKDPYKDARNKFIETAKSYLSSSIFFLQAGKGSYKMGKIWTMGENGALKPENIDLERITQGVPKPVIYLPDDK